MTANNPIDLNRLVKSVHAGLRAWHNSNFEIDAYFSQFLLYKENIKISRVDGSISHRLAVNELLDEGIQDLFLQDQTAADILKLRFMDNAKVRGAAYQLGLSIDQLKRQQKGAIQQLAQIIYNKEIALREQFATKLESNLEAPTYVKNRLFGIDTITEKLTNHLLQEDDYWVIFITGIGGIGKTTLADTAVREVIRHFHYESIIWMRNKQDHDSAAPPQWHWLLEQIYGQLFPDGTIPFSQEQQIKEIRNQLKSAPYLLVIDNLETEEETIFLLNQLRDLADPSKFLLTSRARPPGQAGVYVITLDELSRQDAIALMRHHAKTIGIIDISQASDKVLAPIYEATGGNPLAIKIVISLTAVIPIKHLLADLTEAKVTQIEEMYRYIYWQAWHSLRSEAQAILRMMPLAAENGVTQEQIKAMTSLSEKELWLGIHELVSRSLLEVRGNVWDRRYGIHRLTESFLRTEIIHWPEELL